MQKNELTYRQAGVDIDAGNKLVERIKPAIRTTDRAGTVGQVGGFAALFDPRAAGYDDPILVSATDGVGTKLKIAIASGRNRTVGIDLVAMCANDLVVQGAEPLFFLDYFASSKLSIEAATEVIEGIAEGCRQAGAALVGGETAEMPGLYATGDYDLAGFVVGAVNRCDILPKTDWPIGAKVIGLQSSGLHSNGFSLVRKIVSDHELDWRDPAPFESGRSLADALLEPTRIYVRSVLPSIRSGGVLALSHITGGGIVENVPRIVPEGASVVLDLSNIIPPAVFDWVAEAGPVGDAAMLRTFNCGIGMVLVVQEDYEEQVWKSLEEAGEQVVPLGYVDERRETALVLAGLPTFERIGK